MPLSKAATEVFKSGEVAETASSLLPRWLKLPFAKIAIESKEAMRSLKSEEARKTL